MGRFHLKETNFKTYPIEKVIYPPDIHILGLYEYEHDIVIAKSSKNIDAPFYKFGSNPQDYVSKGKNSSLVKLTELKFASRQ